MKRGRTDRVAVFIDGSRAFDLADVVAEQADLRVGARLSVDAQQRLLELDAPHRARDRALRLLALRDRSCREMSERLRSAGYEATVVSDTIAWLRDLDYLNDSRFAAAYLSAKAKSGWGRRRIAAELALKGVERRLIDEALEDEEETGEGGAEAMEALLSLVRRRFGKDLQSDPDGTARRLAGFLGRRGYDWDTIRSVLRTLKDEAGAESELTSP